MRALPSLDLSRLLFEMPCSYCQNPRSCSCGLGIPLNPRCGVCHADHMMWVPRAYLDVVMAAALEYEASHCFMHALRPAVEDADIGFLFPPILTGAECRRDAPTFRIDLMCNQALAYRPVRLSGQGTHNPGG